MFAFQTGCEKPIESENFRHSLKFTDELLMMSDLLLSESAEYTPQCDLNTASEINPYKQTLLSHSLPFGLRAQTPIAAHTVDPFRVPAERFKRPPRLERMGDSPHSSTGGMESRSPTGSGDSARGGRSSAASRRSGDYPPYTSRPSSNDACATIVQGLMHFNLSSDDDFSRKACESLVKKMKDKRDELDALIGAVYSRGDDSAKCVTIARTLDGRLQVAGRKGFPHVVYAKIFRYPDLHKNELKHVPLCENAFDLKGDSVCVNPYHYERIVNPGIGCSMELKIDALHLDTTPGSQDDDYIEHRMRTTPAMMSPPARQFFDSPQKTFGIGFTPTNCNNNPILDAAPMKFNKQESLLDTHHVDQLSHDQLMHEQQLLERQILATQMHEQQLLDERRRKVELERIVQEQERQEQLEQQQMQYMRLQHCGSAEQPAIRPNTQSVMPHGDISAEQYMPMEMEVDKEKPTQQQYSDQMNQPFYGQQYQHQQQLMSASLSQMHINSLASPTLSTMENGSEPEFTPYSNMPNVRSVNGNVLRVTSFEPPDEAAHTNWGCFVYYEKTQRVGELQAKQNLMYIDGGCGSSPNRYCLGLEVNLDRDEMIERVRLNICKGLRLSYKENGDVWVQIYTHYPVFVHSQFLDRESGRTVGDVVHKVYPGAKLKIFDLVLARQTLRNHWIATLKAKEHMQGKVTDMDEMFRGMERDVLERMPDIDKHQLNLYDLYLEKIQIMKSHEATRGADELNRFCVARMSFIKGWGPDYPLRPDVTDCPCWIEVKMNRAYTYLDQLLTEEDIDNLPDA